MTYCGLLQVRIHPSSGLFSLHAALVPRDVDYTAIYDLDPECLESPVPGRKKLNPKGKLKSKRPNWVHSLDGHDKMMGYQNLTCPLAIYGCLDTVSLKLLWLRVWVTNSDPQSTVKYYLDYLFQAKVMASFIRFDQGTKTGMMATVHTFLHDNLGSNIDPIKSVIYGPSTSSQVNICK